MISFNQNHNNSSFSISKSILPTNKDIKNLGDIHYSKTKTLIQEHQIYGGCVWLLSKLNNHIFHDSDFNLAEEIGITEKKFTTVKKCLSDAEYISYKILTHKGIKGSKYTKGKNFRNLTFTKKKVSITIECSNKKRKSTPQSTKPNKEQNIKTLTRPLSKSTVYEHTTHYSYEVESEFKLPNDEMIHQLLESYCGNYQLKHKRASDRLRACASIIDLLRSEHYSETRNTFEEEVIMFMEGSVVVSEKYHHINQHRLLAYIGSNKSLLSSNESSYNTDGLVVAKETLKKLGWLEVQSSQNGADKDSNRHTGERYLASSIKEGKYLHDDNGDDPDNSSNALEPESKSYRLSHAFYAGIDDSRSSKKSITIKKIVRTPYRALAMCELKPEVFDIFDKVADTRNKKGWDTPTRSYQKWKLENFDYLRHHFDKKTYQDIENSRVYTTISSLPREFRPYITIDGEDTVEVDIKTAHAVFITNFMSSKKEKKKWLKLIYPEDEKYDIYYHLIDTLGVHPDSKSKYPTRNEQRDRCKKVLNAFFNGASNQENFDKSLKFKDSFLDYMEKEFPNILQTIDLLIKRYSVKVKTSNRNGVALKLQEIESDIMGTYFMTETKWDCISIHDGVMVKKSEAKELCKAVVKRAKDKYNLYIRVDYK